MRLLRPDYLFQDKVPFIRKPYPIMTPFDPTRYLHTGKLPLLRELLEQGRVLQSDGSEEIYRDIEKNRELLDAHPSEAIQRLKIYPAEHGLLGRRMTAITDIAAFLSDICDRR